MNRRTKFLTGCIYHLYNRGNRKAPILHDDRDYLYFLRQLRGYFKSYPVTLLAYCLMPNHYHLLARPEGENAISQMLQAFGTSLSKTYNEKYQTAGSLFQGRFREEHVGEADYLMRVARAIR